MQNLQEVYNRILEAKRKQKDLKTAYKDALKVSMEYVEVDDKIKVLRDRKKQIEETIKSQFSDELIKIDDLKIDIETDSELLSDLSMSKLMKGETVEVEDKFGNQYEPIFKVRFKKT
jgi:predicted phage-related endonuclease